LEKTKTGIQKPSSSLPLNLTGGMGIAICDSFQQPKLSPQTLFFR